MEITCLTYNIHKAIGNDGIFNTERIARVCENERADIIALQEVDNGVPRSRHKDLAADLGERLGFHWRLGLNVDLKVGSYGNATLSRWAFGESQNLDLTWAIKKKRGCLSGIVNTPAGPIFVMNFHLGLSRIERHFQIKNLLESEWVKTHRSLPVLALGDSNERTRYMDIFMNLGGFRNAAGELKRKIKTWPSFAPIWNLDKIFYNASCSAIHYEVVKNPLTRIASDHLPVKAVIRI
jgi:endonuclease/exonuclease/phosphatase family metal-dependent hydrolase